MGFVGENTDFSLVITCALLMISCTVILSESLSANPISPRFHSDDYPIDKNGGITEIQNIITFARLYGYLRFFHPSDQARAIKWDRFALHGVQFVKDAETQAELLSKLRELFNPIAPTVRLYPVDQNPPKLSPTLTPKSKENLKLVTWQHKSFGFGTYDSYKSIRLNRPSKKPATPLFKEHADPGEVVEKNLGKGLAAQIPLALFSKDGQTIRPEDAPSAEPMQALLDSMAMDTLTANSQALRYANVVIAWNIFQHFYPYFNVVDVNWENVLRDALIRTFNDQNPEDFLKTLRWMVAQLKDGHGTVIPPVDTEDYLRFPFKVQYIQNKIIIDEVSSILDEKTCFKQGDLITSINNKPANQWLEEEKKLISGTLQHKTITALRRLTYGLGETYKIELSRPGETVTCKLTQQYDLDIKFKSPDPFEEVRSNIYYVDLRSISMNAIKKKADTLASAKGIIFDLRGYPNGNHEVLQYLSKKTLRSPRWMIPQYIYPDQQNIVGYDKSGRWTITPKKPFFSGKKVFLSNKNTISYGESIMGIVEHYRLGEIVGETTAGANGNSTEYTLPGNYRIRWTGMRVLKHDYSQHHLIGIPPTVAVEPTIDEVRAGKDAYLEEAIKIINSSVEN